MENRVILGLIKKFRLGDMEAFPLIYNEFKDLIRFYACKAKDEDLFQELTVFLLELLYGIELLKFEQDSSDTVTRYIAVGLRNRYISALKSKAKEKKLLTELRRSDSCYTECETEGMCLKDLVETLSPKQRQVIGYRYICGYSDEEICRFLKISRQAVHRIRCRGLNNLKKFYM